MAPLLLGYIALALLVGQASAAFQCQDEAGAPVDWYVLYKVPVIKSSKNYLLRTGLAYLYVTSAHPDADWTLSALSVNDSRSAPGRTLAPLYSAASATAMHALYNDDPPSSAAGTTYGHTKGVVLTDTTGGFWLVHSVPNFPPEPLSPETQRKNKYSYPGSATRYGQSFLCVSLLPDQMNVLGTQLMFNRPKVYSSAVTDTLSKKYANLTLALQSRYVLDPPWFHKAVLRSRGGVEFTSYAKASSFGKDLYSSWVAPDLGSDLQVETWSNGAGALPSDCRAKFHVMEVHDLAIKLNSSLPIQFKNSQDHSKWAISGPQLNVVCIGDINRMEAQLKRGGGTVCFTEPSIWKRYSKLVQDLKPCPRS